MKPTKQLIFPLICILTFILVIISSCKKDDLSADATVINSGDPAADGCGWLIKINSTGITYSPVNLSVMFETDGLKVRIAYRVLKTKFGCGDVVGGGTLLTQIQLDGITKE